MMKIAAHIAVPIALLAAPLALAEDAHGLQLRPKSAIATVVPHSSAPYVQPLGEPQPQPLVGPRDLRQDQSRSSCESERALCYDPSSGHIVYKPARQLMPGVPGLQAESVSLKRDKLVFKYSF